MELPLRGDIKHGDGYGLPFVVDDLIDALMARRCSPKRGGCTNQLMSRLKRSK